MPLWLESLPALAWNLKKNKFHIHKEIISAKLTVYVANINNDLVEDLHKSFTYATLGSNIKLYSVAVCHDT